jgi:hypothetical protein
MKVGALPDLHQRHHPSLHFTTQININDRTYSSPFSRQLPRVKSDFRAPHEKLTPMNGISVFHGSFFCKKNKKLSCKAIKNARLSA